ncbi:MAG: DEAD/DEAH box helicase [Nitrososphaerota archaeon]|nr:DEAD/DEAH box helicase [Nitrososphaerota archaeon]
MATGPVEVVVQDQELRIVTTPDSDLLSGEHRIFLSNVLGLGRSEEFDGYSTSGSRVIEAMKDVVEYLRGKGILVKFDEGAREIVEGLDEQKRLLERTLIEGRSLKHRWVRRVTVPGLRRPLKSYQIPAVAHMVAVENGANFSVPGSGKTTIALSAFKVLKDLGKVEKLVVVGPRASFMPWEDECRSCFGKAPVRVRMVGTPTAREQLYRLADRAEMVLMTYQMASNDKDELATFLRRHRSMLVLDESHNIKRIQGGKWSDSLLQIAPFAARRVILSGTPIPNSILDIWSQITFLWPDRSVLGDRNEFKGRVDRAGPGSPVELREAIYPLYWRIKKSDLHLPRPRFNRITVSMSRYQQEIYDAMAAKTLAEVASAPEDQMKLRLWRRAKMIRLLQAASNPTLLTEVSDEFKIPPFKAEGLPVEQIIERYPEFEMPRKMKAAVELVRDLVGKGQKVLLWTAFVHNIETFEKLFARLKPATIHGAIPKDEDEDEFHNREQIVRDFKQTAKYQVLIANPSALAESVSLQKACYHAIYYDRTFNAAHFMQSQDRIHRIGLGPNDVVHYYILQSKGTIDEVIDSRLEEKIKVMNEILAEDFQTLDLESSEGTFSEESESEKDFSAVIQNLEEKYGGAVLKEDRNDEA